MSRGLAAGAVAVPEEPSVKIAIGSDHAGFHLKDEIALFLRGLGHEVVDVGTYTDASVDYPDFARLVAEEVAEGKVDRGIAICGTGIGMAMAANKVPGIRAAVSHDEYTAEMSRRHNDANVLTVGSRVLTPELAKRVVQVWMETEFDGNRHLERVNKIGRLDKAPEGQDQTG